MTEFVKVDGVKELRRKLIRAEQHIVDLENKLSRAEKCICAHAEREHDSGMRIAEQNDKLAGKQARIDELMLEYCPEEMTEEQLEEWGRNQRATTPDETGTVTPSPTPMQPSAESLLRTAITEYAVANVGIGSRNPDLSEAFAFLQQRVRELDAAKLPSVACTSAEDAVRTLTDDQIYQLAWKAGWDVRYEDYDGDETQEPHLWCEEGDDSFASLRKFVRGVEAALAAAQSRAQGGVDSGGVG